MMRRQKPTHLHQEKVHSKPYSIPSKVNQNQAQTLNANGCANEDRVRSFRMRMTRQSLEQKYIQREFRNNDVGCKWRGVDQAKASCYDFL
ncbi:hypothetical protein Tco_1403661 [Tanacetum coccineum]